MMNPAARVEALNRFVKLTDDQKAKATDIYTKTQDEMRKMMREGERDQQGNREKMMELMRSTREQVRAILTEEQKKKFDEMPQRGAEQGGRGKDRRGGKSR
jgi:Spy/CpxP family protein refolding chaperone